MFLHTQLEMVKFLVEERGAEVNQQDRKRGWTPLHRAARMCVPQQQDHHAPP